jgi:AcrR family transcriptional regulator
MFTLYSTSPMPSSAHGITAAGPARRTPIQRRSRERVERILKTAEQIVVHDGIDALSTRAVAVRAKVPVATLYQYFADREAIAAALIERHVAAMDERLAADLAALETLSVRSLVETTVLAYVAGYAERPSYPALWFQGRVGPEIVAFVRERSELLAAQMLAFTTAAGILRPETDLFVLRLAAEMIDAFLAVAYRDDLEGDQRVLREGTEMLVGYIERYATERGIAGIAARDVSVPLTIGAS